MTNAMTTDERLGLAVRAELAQRRAGAAQRSVDAHDRIVGPYWKALEQFEGAHGRRPDFKNRADLAIMGGLLDAAGGADVTWEQIQAAMRATVAARDAQGEAVDAMTAMMFAWRGDGQAGTVLEWVGVNPDTFDRAVREALASA